MEMWGATYLSLMDRTERAGAQFGMANDELVAQVWALKQLS